MNRTSIINNFLIILTLSNNDLAVRFKILEDQLKKAQIDDIEKIYEEIFLPQIKEIFEIFVQQFKANRIRKSLAEAKDIFENTKPGDKYEQVIYNFYSIYLNRLAEDFDNPRNYDLNINQDLFWDLVEAFARFFYFVLLSKLITEKQKSFSRNQREFIYSKLKFYAERILAILSILGIIEIFPEHSQFERNVRIHRTIIERQYNLSKTQTFTSVADILNS